MVDIITHDEYGSESEKSFSSSQNRKGDLIETLKDMNVVNKIHQLSYNIEEMIGKTYEVAITYRKIRSIFTIKVISDNTLEIQKKGDDSSVEQVTGKFFYAARMADYRGEVRQHNYTIEGNILHMTDVDDGPETVRISDKPFKGAIPAIFAEENKFSFLFDKGVYDVVSEGDSLLNYYEKTQLEDYDLDSNDMEHFELADYNKIAGKKILVYRGNRWMDQGFPDQFTHSHKYYTHFDGLRLYLPRDIDISTGLKMKELKEKYGYEGKFYSELENYKKNITHNNLNVQQSIIRMDNPIILEPEQRWGNFNFPKEGVKDVRYITKEEIEALLSKGYDGIVFAGGERFFIPFNDPLETNKIARNFSK